MEIKRFSGSDITSLLPGEPLWKRVPTVDTDGTRLSDFMMIIPRLRDRPRAARQAIVQRIEGVLRCYQDKVVFADLNLALNVLWVSVRPVPGICLELPTAIKLQVPEALLVSHKFSND
ncbi:MAG TPA: hypothetical protein EYP40_02250 [Chromatiales bacterium]|nr:hypothetical protein [Chromatiales bacterium]